VFPPPDVRETLLLKLPPLLWLPLVRALLWLPPPAVAPDLEPELGTHEGLSDT